MIPSRMNPSDKRYPLAYVTAPKLMTMMGTLGETPRLGLVPFHSHLTLPLAALAQERDDLVHWDRSFLRSLKLFKTDQAFAPTLI